MKPFQLLNHFPHEDALTDKGYLAEHLQRFDRAQTKYAFGAATLVPDTYCLYSPSERRRFVDQLPPEDSPERLWILKPAGWSRGRGIRILWELDELRTWVSQGLASYKVPSTITVLDDALPRNATGKVLKHVLRGDAENTFLDD